MAQPQAVPEMPATIRSSEIVGRWGYAAFHRQEDRTRTEAAARGQCRQAVVINQGPGGGVMMYLADQSELQELRLKGAPNNRNFIGPAGEPAGGPQDREIVELRRPRDAAQVHQSGNRRPLRHRHLCALRAGAPAASRRPRRRNSGVSHAGYGASWRVD